MYFLATPHLRLLPGQAGLDLSQLVLQLAERASKGGHPAALWHQVTFLVHFRKLFNRQAFETGDEHVHRRLGRRVLGGFQRTLRLPRELHLGQRVLRGRR